VKCDVGRLQCVVERMRLTIDRIPLLIGAMFTLVTWPAFSTGTRSGSEANLYRVRKIYLATQKNDDLSEQGIVAFISLRPALTEALSGYGFTVVVDPTEADAVMYGGNTIGWVVLDGPPMDPPKYGFQFWLTSAKHNFKWRTEFNISSHENESEVGRKAVMQATRNLFQAWKKSAKRAGILVGDRLP
jgi:hypothetical protein